MDEALAFSLELVLVLLEVLPVLDAVAAARGDLVQDCGFDAFTVGSAEGDRLVEIGDFVFDGVDEDGSDAAVGGFLAFGDADEVRVDVTVTAFGVVDDHAGAAASAADGAFEVMGMDTGPFAVAMAVKNGLDSEPGTGVDE
nr:hypothetical protein [Arthrobacter sp. SW1]